MAGAALLSSGGHPGAGLATVDILEERSVIKDLSRMKTGLLRLTIFHLILGEGRESSLFPLVWGVRTEEHVVNSVFFVLPFLGKTQQNPHQSPV